MCYLCLTNEETGFLVEGLVHVTQAAKGLLLQPRGEMFGKHILVVTSILWILPALCLAWRKARGMFGRLGSFREPLLQVELLAYSKQSP